MGFISFIFEWFTILDLLLIEIIKIVFYKIFVLDFYKQEIFKIDILKGKNKNNVSTYAFRYKNVTYTKCNSNVTYMYLSITKLVP